MPEIDKGENVYSEFLEMWGGWMLSSDVAGVLQEAGDAYSRART